MCFEVKLHFMGKMVKLRIFGIEVENLNYIWNKNLKMIKSFERAYLWYDLRKSGRDLRLIGTKISKY